MLSSTDNQNKLKTWGTELGPFSIGSVISGHSLLDFQLSQDIYRALGHGQGGVDVAFSIGFFCDLGAAARAQPKVSPPLGAPHPAPPGRRRLEGQAQPSPRAPAPARPAPHPPTTPPRPSSPPPDKPMRYCGLRQSNPDTEAAPFAAFRLDTTGTRTGGALVTETDMLEPSTRVLRNMTGLRLRLAITGESREADLYTTIFNLGTILWVTFISQWFAEIVMLNLNPRRKYYEEAVYRRVWAVFLSRRRGVFFSRGFRRLGALRRSARGLRASA